MLPPGESRLTNDASSQPGTSSGSTEPPAPSVATIAPGPPAPKIASELLSRIWQQSLPLIRARVLRLDASAQDALCGRLTQEMRLEASDLAHKLAGSLGMFGLPEGTEIARAMEVMLEAEGTIDATAYSGLAARLRSVLAL